MKYKKYGKAYHEVFSRGDGSLIVSTVHEESAEDTETEPHDGTHHLPAVPGSKVQSFRFHTAESLCGQPPVRNGIVIGQFGKFDLLRPS